MAYRDYVKLFGTFNSLYWILVKLVEVKETPFEYFQFFVLDSITALVPRVRNEHVTFNSLYWIRKPKSKAPAPGGKAFNSLYWILILLVCRWVPPFPRFQFFVLDSRAIKPVLPRSVEDAFFQFFVLDSAH